MQATTGRTSYAEGPRPTAPARLRDDTAEVVSALYGIAVAMRRLAPRDPVDTSAIRVLWHLGEVGSCRLSELAELSGFDLSTVSRQVRDLGDAGYVVRSDDPHDRRAVILSISPDGRAVLDGSLANRVDALGPVLAAWSSDDRTELLRLLRLFAHQLGEGHIPPTDATDPTDSPEDLS